MCLTPINLKKTTLKQKLNDSYALQQVPCGRCLECRRLRVNSWYIRINNQLSVSRSAYFVTLTYDEDSLRYSSNGLLTLHYSDFSDFIKSIRHQFRYRAVNPKTGKKKWYYDKVPRIKYFAVGEYGSITHRPHYHAIIFGLPDPQLVADHWKHGHVHVGTVKDQSIFYTLKYALKSVHCGPKDPDDDRVPEKALMSKGIGLSFLTPDMQKYFKEDPSRPVTMLGNKKIGLPRYYRDKLFNDVEKITRNERLLPYMDKRYDQISDPLFPQRVERMYKQSKEYLQKTD